MPQVPDRLALEQPTAATPSMAASLCVHREGKERQRQENQKSLHNSLREGEKKAKPLALTSAALWKLVRQCQGFLAPFFVPFFLPPFGLPFMATSHVRNGILD